MKCVDCQKGFITIPRCEVCGEMFRTESRINADAAIIKAALDWFHTDGSMHSIEQLTLSIMNHPSYKGAK